MWVVRDVAVRSGEPFAGEGRRSVLGLQEARAPLGKGKGKTKQEEQNKDESKEAKRRRRRSEKKKKERGGETRRREEEREGTRMDGKFAIVTQRCC